MQRSSDAGWWIAIGVVVLILIVNANRDDDNDRVRTPTVTLFRPAANVPGNGYSGDLDCADIGREVSVGVNDPNGLDADNDGIGCEGW